MLHTREKKVKYNTKKIYIKKKKEKKTELTAENEVKPFINESVR